MNAEIIIAIGCTGTTHVVAALCNELLLNNTGFLCLLLPVNSLKSLY